MLKLSHDKGAHCSLAYSHDKGARRSFAFCSELMMMRDLWLVFIALTSVQAHSQRKYERVDETCVNSAISSHTSKHNLHCGQLCEINSPNCDGFCFSSADSSCTLHQIVDMGAETVEKGFRTYKLFTDGMDAVGSFFHCISMRGFLALPMNLEQENFLQQLSNGNDIFLPADDFGHEGYWYMSGGGNALEYSNWQPGEPNGGVIEQCALLTSNGWIDVFCPLWKARVCQAPRPEICTTLPHPTYPDLRCYKRKL